MKILILSASTGGGHIKASKALESYILEHEENSEVKVVDALEYINPLINKIVTKGYIILAKYFNFIYKRIYSVTDRASALTLLTTRLIVHFAKKLIPLIEDFSPDVIITTHPFPTEMISILKGQNKINTPLLCIMTDYAAHRTWIKPNVDEYCVASEAMRLEMIDRGVTGECIHPYGIPVSSDFFQKTCEDKLKLLEELQLDENKSTVLIMAGSFGVQNIEEIYMDISEISMDFQVVVLTGNNQRLYNKIKKSIELSKKETRVIKFTREVHRYMNLADILITKPGGLTVSEALASNLPMVVFDAIPGQEESNARFLLEHNMAISIGRGHNCKDTIETLFKDEEKLKQLSESCTEFDKSSATKNLLQRIRIIIEENNSQVVKNPEIA
ncbi:MAG: glycosyltransferase [Clostridium sp.]|uniref:MGDG synthase family glycosyltransferase n=1 Tax=Clostridium sp. TaxID=1506 RepID=UPI0030746858